MFQKTVQLTSGHAFAWTRHGSPDIRAIAVWVSETPEGKKLISLQAIARRDGRFLDKSGLRRLAREDALALAAALIEIAGPDDGAAPAAGGKEAATP